MITIGLTGGIGSGKSYVARQFAERGIQCYNCDIRSKVIMDINDHVVESLQQRFGDDIYTDGYVNRKMLAEKIFSSEADLQWVNNLVHPIVYEDFDEWRKMRQADAVLIESAILVESGFYRFCDKIIVVEAPIGLRINRVMQRDGLSEKQVRQRISAQITDEERRKFANYVVVNDEMNNIAIEIDKIVSDLHNKQ
ncbi:MAG: dephospho-CoA kinase [Salinivirgaceae bacterium]|nr:dephospho-CoA kinase [Salinivirgaceae bacterium]